MNKKADGELAFLVFILILLSIIGGCVYEVDKNDILSHSKEWSFQRR